MTFITYFTYIFIIQQEQLNADQLHQRYILIALQSLLDMNNGNIMFYIHFPEFPDILLL